LRDDNNVITFEDNNPVQFQLSDFKLYDFFYTKEEERKIKLKKFING